MKYKCNRCDFVFDECAMCSVKELVGEYWGQPAYETKGVCPQCGCDDLETCDDESKTREDLQEDCFNNDIDLDREYCADCIHKNGCRVYLGLPTRKI